MCFYFFFSWVSFSCSTYGFSPAVKCCTWALSKTLFLCGWVYSLNTLEGGSIYKSKVDFQRQQSARTACPTCFLSLFAAERANGNLGESFCRANLFRESGIPRLISAIQRLPINAFVHHTVRACCSTPWSCFMRLPLRRPPNGTGTEPAEWMPIVCCGFALLFLVLEQGVGACFFR